MLLKDHQVAAHLGCARSTTWEMVRDGLLTKPVRRGLKWSRWPSSEIECVEAAIISGVSDDELRQLVRELLAARVAGRGAA